MFTITRTRRKERIYVQVPTMKQLEKLDSQLLSIGDVDCGGIQDWGGNGPIFRASRGYGVKSEQYSVREKAIVTPSYRPLPNQRVTWIRGHL